MPKGVTIMHRRELLLLGIGLSVASLSTGSGLGSLAPEDLDFSQGELGEVPPGWILPLQSVRSGYIAQLVNDVCPAGRCVTLSYTADANSEASQPTGTLIQSFDASRYRGMKLRLTAWLRVAGTTPKDQSQLIARVVRQNGQNGFFDNMSDRPVKSGEWQQCAITGRIDDDAKAFVIQVLAQGYGKTTISGMTFTPDETDSSVTGTPQMRLPAPEPAFQMEDLGKTPAGWSLPPVSLSAGYSSQVQKTGCRLPSKPCAGLVKSEGFSNGPAIMVYQTGAAPLRGRTVAFSAWTKVLNASKESAVQLWLRIDTPSGSGPVLKTEANAANSAAWTAQTLSTRVPADANEISFGVIGANANSVLIDTPLLALR